LLAGPRDEDLPSLAEWGYDPRAAIKIAQRRAEQEEKLRMELDGDTRWRRDRLRDVVAAREMAHELMDAILKALADRQLSSNDVFPDRESLRRFMRSMPSTDVAITLKTTRHRDPNLRWTANDITDVDALSLAVPYCDVVVTENFAHHVLTVSGIAKRMDIVVLRTLDDLLTHWS
jgi:hypothetical protein